MYSDGLSHLLDELRLIERRIDALIRRRSTELHALESLQEHRADPETVAMDADIGSRALASAEANIFLPLPEVGARFGLTRTEQHILALCLAPEVGGQFGGLFAALQQGLALTEPRRPSVGLALDLLIDDAHERLKARALFAPEAPLVKWGLISLGAADVPLLARPMLLDERVAAYLLQVPQGAVPHVPTRLFDELVLPDGLVERIRNFLSVHAVPGSPDTLPAILHIHGPEGSDSDLLTEAICAELGVALLMVDAEEVEQALDRRICEAMLSDAAICVLAGDGLSDKTLRRIVEATQHRLLFVTAKERWRHDVPLAGRMLVEISLPRPSRAQRRTILSGLIGNGPMAAALAAKFRFTPGRLRAAVSEAASRAAWDGPADFAALQSVCRAQATPNLGALAQRIAPRGEGIELIIPEDARAQIEAICSRARHRDTVFEDWGFDDRLRLGKGLNVLFCGTPGTGKTLGAEVIARRMALDLYRVDLSRIVSKYIGETEKQLGQLFDEAQGSDAILFFDEADALFGKRSEVKDAHDRYANIEIGYLLQRMEEYDGIAILATNLRRNLDDAFTRRLQFIVEFPYPEQVERARIWRAHMPVAMPIAADLDIAFLAEAFTLSGASIRNCALAAAFGAAEDDSPVTMRHMLTAVRSEYQKMGHVCQPAEFGRFKSELWEEAA